ncbi:MAG: HD domain-containing protein [Chloroflexi bacterium]|nr:HD domain-containing protein [Chloroflexota bacterium]
MSEPLRVLIVEDSEDDALLLLRELKCGGYDPTFERVDAPAAMSEALDRQAWDIVLADFVMPRFSGLAALTLLKEKGLDLPFIIVSGKIGEDLAVEAMRSGAQDYLVKGKLGRLIPAVERELRDAASRRERRRAEDELRIDIAERQRAEEALKNSEQELKQSLEKLQATTEETIHAIALIVEMRDPYTSGHQRRVARLATAIAREMGFPKDRVAGIEMAADIHDVGKIYVPAEFLSKPSRLTETEFGLIKVHCRIGHDILKTIAFPWPIADIVLQHHERMDGSGYPSGLKGEDILIEARIMGVADVVEAMASHRPYRPAMGVDKALEELSKNVGVLYDPDVACACAKVFTKIGLWGDW